MKRARSDSDKETRSQAILESAATLFDARPYPGLTISDIALSAGVAKGTTYLYFATKETLFLSLLSAEFDDWAIELATALTKERRVGARRVTALIADTLASRARLLRLLALCGPVLEPGVDEDTLREWRSFLELRLTELGTLLSRVSPGLPAEDARAGLLRIVGLAAGLGPLANPPHPVVDGLRPDLAVELRAAAERLLVASEARA